MKKQYEDLFYQTFRLKDKATPLYVIVRMNEESCSMSGMPKVDFHVKDLSDGTILIVSEFDFHRTFTSSYTHDPVTGKTTVDELMNVCQSCEGGGMIAKLYPQGHTEVKCEDCDGTGLIESEEPFVGVDPAFGTKCQCGIEKIGGGLHSDWCDKYEKAIS